MTSRWRVTLVSVLFPLLQTAPATTWTPALSHPGIFDVAGPRSDGRLVVAGAAGLALATTDGQVATFASALGAFQDSESYIALSRGLDDPSRGCSFGRDTVAVLRLSASGAPGVDLVDPAGQVRSLASVPGASTLGGIVFDDAGSFAHRLLVTGPDTAGKAQLFAIACDGSVARVGLFPDAVEGGIAIAPAGFGAFAGAVIAANELTGAIYAMLPTGESRTVATVTALPSGADIGVESLGFVPPQRSRAYVADRATPGNAHPGTDRLLRLDSDALEALGARPGDLLGATEGGLGLVRVRCAADCVVTTLVSNDGIAHGEGHLVFVADAAPPAATTTAPVSGGAVAHDDGGGTGTAIWIVAGGAIAAAALAVGIFVWRRRP